MLGPAISENLVRQVGGRPAPEEAYSLIPTGGDDQAESVNERRVAHP